MAIPTTPRKRKTRRRRPVQKGRRFNGLLSNGNLQAAGKFGLKTAIYLIIGFFTILGLLEARATSFVEETVRPMLEDQRIAIEKVGDNAEENTQAIMNLHDTMNLQWDWMKEKQDRQAEDIDKMEERIQ